MQLKLNISGVTEEQGVEIYRLSLQYFNKEEVAEVIRLPVELVSKVLERTENFIVRFHKKYPTRRSGDMVSWQRNLDQLKLIRQEAWRIYHDSEIGGQIKILDQLRRVNRDMAEIEGLLAPIKVESQTNLTIADESRKALKEIFGGKQ